MCLWGNRLRPKVCFILPQTQTPACSLKCGFLQWSRLIYWPSFIKKELEVIPLVPKRCSSYLSPIAAPNWEKRHLNLLLELCRKWLKNQLRLNEMISRNFHQILKSFFFLVLNLSVFALKWMFLLSLKVILYGNYMHTYRKWIDHLVKWFYFCFVVVFIVRWGFSSSVYIQLL